MKARQGFIFAGFFYRLLTIKPGFQIKNLKKKPEKNQKEREAIEDDLLELYQALIPDGGATADLPLKKA